MARPRASNQSDAPPEFYIGSVIVTIVVSGALFGWGLWSVTGARFYLLETGRPTGSLWVLINGLPALFLGWAVLIAAVAYAVNVLLTCITGIEGHAKLVARCLGLVAFLCAVTGLCLHALR